MSSPERESTVSRKPAQSNINHNYCTFSILPPELYRYMSRDELLHMQSWGSVHYIPGNSKAMHTQYTRTCAIHIKCIQSGLRASHNSHEVQVLMNCFCVYILDSFSFLLLCAPPPLFPSLFTLLFPSTNPPASSFSYSLFSTPLPPLSLPSQDLPSSPNVLKAFLHFQLLHSTNPSLFQSFSLSSLSALKEEKRGGEEEEKQKANDVDSQGSRRGIHKVQ